MNQKEQEFQAENGMSSHRAWEWVLQWSQEGKLEQAIKGCEEILQYFPDRDEVRHFYEKLMEVKIEQEENGEDSESNSGGTLGKLKGFIAEKTKKFHELSAGNEKSTSPNNTKGIPSEEERMMGALCYFWIFVLIPLFLKRESRYVQFHAWQGLVLTGAMWIIHTILLSIFRYFNFGFITISITAFIVLVYAVGVLSAYKGILLKMPIIYPISEKLRKMFELPE